MKSNFFRKTIIYVVFTLFITMTQVTHAINISTCSSLNETGATYYLTADIINSSTSYCINISANNVTLDCQGHLIDGDDLADYGIWIYRSVEETTNITIKNCIVKDWDTANIHLENADENNIVNVTSSSSPDYGIYLRFSFFNIFSNITVNSNDAGINLKTSSSNTFRDITSSSNTHYGIIIYANSDNNTIANSTISNSIDAGLYFDEYDLDDPENNTIYNCLFNNSVNVKIDDGISNPNYFNTTKQLGTRIYSNGNYIGGNYYTNSTGNGYSDICIDSNHDGFCDNALNLSSGTSKAYDYLPYSDEFIPDSIPPSYSDNSTNTTQAGALTEFRVKWTDNYNLTGGGFIFYWYNGTNWTKTSNSGDLESGEQSFSELSATLTFFDNFDDGDLGSDWTTYSSDATYGRIGVRTEDAHSGSYSVIADVNTNGHDNLNELITNYDFSGATDVVLTFWHREWSDEDTSGADHTDHYNADAYYFTCDGTNWKHLGDLGSPTDWTKVTVNITADPDWCGTADSNFKIKLTQYDNYALTSDGRGFDDINITYTVSGDQEANKTPVTYSDISLDTYEGLDNITATVYVSYYNNSGSQANGNTNPTLWLEVYNGTDWVDEGDFQVTGTGNHSKTVTTASVLEGWETENNRDIRISARYMDYNDSSHYDQINWTGVWVEAFSEQELLNDSFREFNSTNCINDTVCWSNVTKTVTSQVNATIKWKVKAKDQIGNWNETPVFSYQTTSGADTTPPTISNEAINDTEININESIKLNATVTDDTAVDTVKFFIEAPYGNLNLSTPQGTGDEYFLICNKTNACKTNQSGSYNFTSVWANDTSGNINTTTVSLQFNVTATTTTTTTTIHPCYANETGTWSINQTCTFNNECRNAENVILWDSAHLIFKNHSIFNITGIIKWKIGAIIEYDNTSRRQQK